MTKPEIVDLSNVEVTEVKITDSQFDAAVATLRHAGKSAKYAKLLKEHVEEFVNRKPAVEPDPAPPPGPNDPVLAMVIMLIAEAKDRPDSDLHRICSKRGLLGSVEGGRCYTTTATGDAN